MSTVTDLRALIRAHIMGTKIWNDSQIDYKTACELSEAICTQIVDTSEPEPLWVRSDTKGTKTFEVKK